MDKLIKKITKFAEENDYLVSIDDELNENTDIELVVIDNTKQVVFIGTKQNYLSNPNFEE